MNTLESCPICNSKKIRILFTRDLKVNHYDYEDASYNTHDFRNLLTKDKFLNNCEQVFSYFVCESCDFVFSSPRPTDAEMIIKYQETIKYSTTNKSSYYVSTFDNSINRSIELNKLLSNYIKTNSLKILDYGGAEGKILQSFTSTNKCFVVDYEERTLVSGVKYAGKDYNDITDQKYDIITLCHVLEHLVHPVHILNLLKDLITDDGFLYIEVPAELRKGYKGHEDFITHINVFSESSLKYLMNSIGFEIIELKTKSKPNNNSWELMIYCIVKNTRKFSRVDKTDSFYDAFKSLNKKWILQRSIGKLKYSYYSILNKFS